MTSESLQSHVRIPTWVALKYGKLEYGGKEVTYLSHLRATLAELMYALADQHCTADDRVAKVRKFVVKEGTINRTGSTRYMAIAPTRIYLNPIQL